MSSSLIFSLVARDPDVILCSYTDYQGNFEQIASKIVPKVQKNHRGTIKQSDYYFHFDNEAGITYLLLAKVEFPAELAFEFLDTIKNKFISNYGANVSNYGGYALNSDFGPVLRDQMAAFEKEQNTPSVVEKLKNNVIMTKNTILDANDVLNERGEKMQILSKKSSDLAGNSTSFYRSSQKVKYSQKWKNIRYGIILGGILIALILIIVFSVCGFNFKKCKK